MLQVFNCHGIEQFNVKYSIPTFAKEIQINASTFPHTKNNLKTNRKPFIKTTKK